MRVIGAGFGRQSGPDQGMVNFSVECGEGVSRRKTGPKRVDPPFPVKRPDPVKGDFEGRMMDGLEREANVFGHAAVHFTDETQRYVDLVISLPTCVGHTLHHAAEQGADRKGWAECDEESVHLVRFRLNF